MTVEQEDKLAALRPFLDTFDPNVTPPVEETRAMEREVGGAMAMPAGCVKEESTLAGIPALKITPPVADNEAAVLFFHAGGFSSGSAVGHAAYAAALCVGAKAIGYVPDYRLAPEDPFPAAVEDACAAFHALVDSGLAPERIAVAGDSAGGGIVFSVTQEALRRNMATPGCVYAVSPWADLTQSGESYETRGPLDPLLSRSALNSLAEIYLAGKDAQDERASPLFGRFDGFPPTKIDVGANEVLLSDATRLADKLAQEGREVELHVWQDLIHIFPWFSDYLEDAKLANAQAGEWIRRQLKVTI